LKIIYTKGQREEAVASMATLKKILSRFVRHHVFHEMSARHRRSNQLYSIKSAFTVGGIEVTGGNELIVSISDGGCPAHSIEIVNPHAMRVYDENPAKGFAVAFYADEAGDFDVRYYLRDEGEDENSPKHMALERITLPQLFEYLQEIIPGEVVEVGEPKK
jgi:hypothetical protein